ncbi:hypothetical protein G7078_00305 [Sphingomonas sinipercae]|uniref:Uncharacterized protein n=1 Tax=Sphingomonas sinipercae TaxID=2714944 RepID=A0A6G7ZKG0_9SPHN|nr:hypothetical protein [Sphingomonas sinipercae]QIL01386.1 hypothetical protein G7078_00305 [Sphingomonas sinipercae]
MNTFLAFAVGGVMLFLIGRSLATVFQFGRTEITPHDRRVAVSIVAVTLTALALIVTVLQLQ